MAEVNSLSPVLSGVAQGYELPENAGMHLFPWVDVARTAGKTIVFPPDQFQLLNTLRASGSNFAEIQFGIEGAPYALANHGLMGKISEEDLEELGQAIPDFEAEADNVEQVLGGLLLNLEVQQAQMATNPATFSVGNKILLAGAAKWSTSTGNPLVDFLVGKEAVRNKIGMYPNVAVFSPSAFNACITNQNITAKFNPTNASIITEEMLAKALGIDKIVIGKSIYSVNGQQTDVWGNNVVMAFVPPVPASGKRKRRQCSFGYTYRKKGHPAVTNFNYDFDTSTYKSKVALMREPYTVGKDAGYLIQNPA